MAALGPAELEPTSGMANKAEAPQPAPVGTLPRPLMPTGQLAVGKGASMKPVPGTPVTPGIPGTDVEVRAPSPASVLPWSSAGSDVMGTTLRPSKTVWAFIGRHGC